MSATQSKSTLGQESTCPGSNQEEKMSYIREKLNFLQGYSEGLELDESKKETKLILGILDLLDEMSYMLDELDEEVAVLDEVVEAIDEDLTDLEVDFYDMDDELYFEEYDDEDDDEDLFSPDYDAESFELYDEEDEE